jgi:hypothetical protein
MPRTNRVQSFPIVLAGLLCLASSAAVAGPFTFVSLPDTQIYSENRFPDLVRTPAVTDPRGTKQIFIDQTRWIVDHAEARGIRYVGHLGDIVQDGNDLDEWANAKEAMDLLLEADIPHGTVMGNHDDNHPPDYARNYLEFFGPQVFEDRPWYTASSPGGGANRQIREHARYKIGFLNFSIDHPLAEIEWANDIVEAHPDTIFVIGTHRYLYDFKLSGGRYFEDVDTLFGVINLPGGPVGAVINPTTAEDLFHIFVKQHPNIVMIHAGHFHSEWLRLDGLNVEEKLIIQILTDYQSTRNGGDGWLRIYDFDFENDEFRFESYSPTIGRNRTTIDHFVETIFLAWDQRSQVIDVLGVTEGQYLLLLEAGFKRWDGENGVPDGWLLSHPDFDTPEERAYYEQYLDELFLGNRPPGFESILDWERLWMVAFAASEDPFDFSDHVRSPTYSMSLDFHDYFTPSSAQLGGWALDDLVEAFAGVDDGAWVSSFDRRRVERRLRTALWLLDWERYDLAAWILERTVLPLIDGCATGGEPDRPRGFWAWLLAWLFGGAAGDAIDRCDAQAIVYPETLEAIDVLGGLTPGS